MKNILLIILSSLFFVSCETMEQTTSSVENPDKPVVKELPNNEEQYFIEIDKGTNGGFMDSTYQVITNKNQMKKAWEQAYSNFLNKKDPPEIDFSSKTIILVSFGMKTSGGYKIYVDSVLDNPKDVIINTVHVTPGDNCVVTEAITFPYQMIEINSTDKKIVFNKISEVIDCEKGM